MAFLDMNTIVKRISQCQLLITFISPLSNEIMSRPQTPHGISPRGSYVNLQEGRDEAQQALFSPSKIEKERLRAEAEVHASLLRKEDDGRDKKKEEVAPAAASPGTSLGSLIIWNEGRG
jgi:hypothetical protein